MEKIIKGRKYFNTIGMQKKSFTRKTSRKRFPHPTFAYERQKSGGFTLIEILIVVAIISILASIVLVGIGPTEQLGRDARRISDLHEVQTALELYYAKCGYYPGGTVVSGSCPSGGYSSAGGYAGLIGVITGSGIGVNTMPNDPQKSKTYYYATQPLGESYILAAILENQNGSVFSGYKAPSVINYSDGTLPTGGCDSPNYCLTL
jgi:prepilin-type N-terminal cleavage/methylation domain-containing protein